MLLASPDAYPRGDADPAGGGLRTLRQPDGVAAKIGSVLHPADAEGLTKLAGPIAQGQKLGAGEGPVVASGEENLYLHALSRAAFATTVSAWKRVDLQLLAMIRDARTRLKAQGIDGDGRVMLTGFSASGSFVNRFAMLHPEEVLAVASGSPGGWALAPVAAVEGESLPYPVGIADVGALTGRAPDLSALRKIRWLFFLGDHDENDAVPYRDSFSESDEELIFRRFGTKPVARWKAAERLYAERGLRARFALYPGAAHEVTAGMRADVERFFEDCLARLLKDYPIGYAVEVFNNRYAEISSELIPVRTSRPWRRRSH